MFRTFLAHLLLISFSTLVGCTSTGLPPAVAQPTPSFVPTDAPTLVADIYERNIHLFDYDIESKVLITETSVQQEDGYTVHDISYASPKTGDVPAYLVVPDGPGPSAGILLMHGSSGSRSTLLPLAKDLVRTGAVVLTISAPSARTPGRDWITFTPQDREEQIQLMLDLRRGVDLLIQHEKVDPSRIGYVGYSYGAAMGGLLAGIEPRIKAYVFMVGDGGLVNHFTDEDGQPTGGFEQFDPETRDRWLDAMEEIEPIHFVPHASASSLFFQNARYDTSVTEEDALAYQAAGSEPKKVQWYESGHGLPSEAYLDMVAWLAEQIGIDLTQFTLSR